MTEFVGGDIERMRYNMAALTVFALMATLAGILRRLWRREYIRVARSRENGIRLAMGARARDIVSLVSTQTLALGGTWFSHRDSGERCWSRGCLRSQLWGIARGGSRDVCRGDRVAVLHYRW
jgi:hypothetical protein